MTLQQLKYILTTAKCGSINEAAKSLFISQPSLSNAIKELEDEFGITIFQRTNKGIRLSEEGIEFLSYAKQVYEQVELLESRYHNKQLPPQHFSVSAQHYAFAVNAFVELVEKYANNEYEFTLRETRTYEIIDDLKNLRSEVGVLYLNAFNEKVIRKLIKEAALEFHPLFLASAHVFISAGHPLSNKDKITLEDLEDYPYLSFEQGEYNSFHFSEEILSTISRKKNIKVSDRATLFNLLIGLNGYTISTGVLSSDLNGNSIIAVPLEIEDKLTVGYLTHKNMTLSKLAVEYIERLKSVIENELAK
ncbi:LysR family transcriptional regulator [Beduini massiliensis]|uniref:LysR family transcriptional regulator n=1 Tax=Beduini massiliensis TaxID=1585974 RepID=UPI00059AA8E5|nr:LysR family transcriptional regulator [Beduini massiliensis]